MVEVVITTIEDEFHFHFRKYFRRRECLTFGICFFTFLIGLVYYTQVNSKIEEIDFILI